MEPMIKHLLREGIAAHNAGRLLDAERLYISILQRDPKHPDANHNLGLIALSNSEVDRALTLLKMAVDASPKVEQYWSNYVGALLQANQLAVAKRMVKKAKKSGIDVKKLSALVSKANNVKESSGPSAQLLSSLIEHYEAGEFDEAQKLALSLTKKFPSHPFSWKALSVLLEKGGHIDRALNAALTAVKLSPEDAEAHNNLADLLQKTGKLEEAEVSCRQAVLLAPDFAEGYNNLGNILRQLGKLDDAAVGFRRALAIKPSIAQAHVNLGVTLQEIARLDEAKTSASYAVDPQLREANDNIAEKQKNQCISDQIEEGFRRAISLDSDNVEAYINLGNHLQFNSKFNEAEECFRHALSINSELGLAHYGLSIALYCQGHKDLALESSAKANELSSSSSEFSVLHTLLNSRKFDRSSHAKYDEAPRGLISNMVVLDRPVERELIASLYEMSSREFKATRDARYGNGICNLDFKLFHEDNTAINKLADDLTKAMTDAVKSEVYVLDSFFNIMGAGGGSAVHDHITPTDRIKELGFGKRKYSLVYYLSAGDQDCSEPGTLELYEPFEEILPKEGMLVIFPASRKHAAKYNGKTDRIMVGANFYSL